MKLLKEFFNAISPLKEKTWEDILVLFQEDRRTPNQYLEGKQRIPIGDIELKRKETKVALSTLKIIEHN